MFLLISVNQFCKTYVKCTVLPIQMETQNATRLPARSPYLQEGGFSGRVKGGCCQISADQYHLAAYAWLLQIIYQLALALRRCQQARFLCCYLLAPLHWAVAAGYLRLTKLLPTVIGFGKPKSHIQTR